MAWHGMVHLHNRRLIKTNMEKQCLYILIKCLISLELYALIAKKKTILPKWPRSHAQINSIAASNRTNIYRVAIKIRLAC